ncbi:hypothetical protein [Aureimonas pseudogalii]|uniref:Fe2+ or Zn2+ uptake regulation protein n=1 Tax=Aureimonas pseudogalii TaxID=1744844 RepID=A0A7W6EEL4_9HYPH|nr:hypothetical protein [Aureimonas pseudogalii]MBB3997230.1 Fe2+ or Zn2+ uptake regulation protein [Aureimonas pseudogalii]
MNEVKVKLTDKQTNVLRAIIRNDEQGRGSITVKELGHRFMRRSSELAREPVNRLVAEGFVTALGTAESGAQCFVATEAGRVFMAKRTDAAA